MAVTVGIARNGSIATMATTEMDAGEADHRPMVAAVAVEVPRIEAGMLETKGLNPRENRDGAVIRKVRVEPIGISVSGTMTVHGIDQGVMSGVARTHGIGT